MYMKMFVFVILVFVLLFLMEGQLILVVVIYFILFIFICRFYFDFSTTYVGVGIICPHIVNCSVMLGAILSWGIMWPYISSKAGDWYPDGLGTNDFKGLYGYKVVFIFQLTTLSAILLQ